MTARMFPVRPFDAILGEAWRTTVVGEGWWSAWDDTNPMADRTLASSFDRQMVEAVALWAERRPDAQIIRSWDNNEEPPL